MVDFAENVALLEALDPGLSELPLLQARLAYRNGDFHRALELARAAPEVADPGSRAQLIGQISDRLGDSAAAFAAFKDMNRDFGICARSRDRPGRGLSQAARAADEAGDAQMGAQLDSRCPAG